MSLATLNQEQPTNEPEATPSTEVQDGTYSEPAPENTAGGEESPPNTIDNAVIVEKEPDQEPDDAVTSVRDGSPDQTALTSSPSTESTTTEQSNTTTSTTEAVAPATEETQTEAVVSVQPKDSTANNVMEAAPALGLLATVPLLIAGGIRRFRRQKKN